MLRPVSQNEILIPVLGLLGLTSLIGLLQRGRMSSSVLAVIALMLAIGLYGSAVGVNNPGFTAGLLVWLAAPLLYGAWVLSGSERLIRGIFWTAAIATIALSGFILLYVAGNTGRFPQIIPAALVQETGAGFNIEGNTTAIRLYGLSSLVALAPMWIVAALSRKSLLLPPRPVIIVAAILAGSAALVGGRNAIVLVSLAIPAMWLVWRAFRSLPWKIPVGGFILGVFALISAPFAIGALASTPVVQRTWAAAMALFTGGNDTITQQSERLEQAAQLIQWWKQAFVTGHGFGTIIPGYARSAERPWTFELQYHLLLAQFGLVGAIITAVLVLVSARAIILAYRARPDLSTPLTVALAAGVSMLIAHGANPYLQAPGHMWAPWLVFVIVNVALLHPTRSATPTNNGEKLVSVHRLEDKCN